MGVASPEEALENPELHHVVLYYLYTDLTSAECESLAAEQQVFCTEHFLNGRIRISTEGLNGTLAGTEEDVKSYISYMNTHPTFTSFHEPAIDWKTSMSSCLPFPDLQVRIVSEVVSFSHPISTECHPSNGGKHVSPEEFHSLASEVINNEDTGVIIDVRNNYEYQVGHFAGATNPVTRKFGDFPEWVRSNSKTLGSKKKILMYCTGGVRCEKASSYIKTVLDNDEIDIYQLSGGIHRYLEAYPKNGLFHGKNFVFDKRGAVNDGGSVIVGKCEGCAEPYDTITGRTRCVYCRMHVLLCPACEDKTDPQSVVCSTHKVSLQELQDQESRLLQALDDDAIAGRRMKKRRKSLRKQLDMIQARIKAF